MTVARKALSAAAGAGGGGGITDPTDISGLQFWLDADSLSATLSNGNGVSSWTDGSSNGFVFDVGTTSLEPTFVTNVQNSLPAVRFDGTDDVLTNATHQTLKPLHAFAVVSIDDLTGDQRAIFGADNNGGMLWRVDTGGLMDLVKQGVTAIGSSSTSLSTATTYLLEVEYDASGNYQFRVNGAADGNGTNNQTIDPEGVVIGQQRPSGFPAYEFDGDMFELVVYTTVLSSSDAADVRTYLNDKWAVY